MDKSDASRIRHQRTGRPVSNPPLRQRGTDRPPRCRHTVNPVSISGRNYEPWRMRSRAQQTERDRRVRLAIGRVVAIRSVPLRRLARGRSTRISRSATSGMRFATPRAAYRYQPSAEVMTMPTHRAIRVPSPGASFELASVGTESPPPGHVRIDVAACGVCGTDSLFVNGAFPACPGRLRPGTR